MNFKKILFIVFFIVLIITIGIFIYKYITNRNNTNTNINQGEYLGSKVSSTNNTSINNDVLSQNNYSNSNELSKENTNQNNNNSTEIVPATPVEEEISSFSTKIYTKDSDRQNNISITCSTLNDTTINNGETFSFCNTVGKATTSKGYEKADVFKDGEVIQALGGGNCQVSSTLYNAVLAVNNLEVTERHSHSNSVPYIEQGNDAAIAYGSYDFKFVNNTGSTIKIKAENASDSVTIQIIKIS